MLHAISERLRKKAMAGQSRPAAVIATFADYAAFFLRLRRSSVPATTSPASEWLTRLVSDGVCIVEGFWSADRCAKARAEVDRVIREYPHYVNGNAKADVRVYGANNASPILNEFGNDQALQSLASAYNRVPTRSAFTLAARMPATPGNQGSGEGWHRDAFFRQVKAILYLSDVSSENGPFQLIRDSHRMSCVLSDMCRANLSYMQYRVEESSIAQLSKLQPERVRTYAGSAGTLILADTSALHRGMPIREGCRYALTNYYFPDDRIDQPLLHKFDVLPVSANAS